MIDFLVTENAENGTCYLKLAIGAVINVLIDISHLLRPKD